MGSGLLDSFLHSARFAHPCTYSGFSNGDRTVHLGNRDASNFGLGGVLSQIQGDVERVVAYCSRASQRRYYTTKWDMLAAVAMCIQFQSYLCGAKFTLRTDHKSLVWLHRFKDTEGMMARWLHALQQFHFPSCTDRAGTMVMQTVYRGFLRPCADNVRDRTAHRPSR